jgi:TatD DNase family protein
MYIDTHLHLENDSNTEAIIKEAYENNVKKLIISGCDNNGILNALELIKRYDNIYATIGYHPSEAGNVLDSDLIELEQYIISNKKVIGLGEIGLDYYYGKDNKEAQLDLFNKQLMIAERLNIPVVIHSRDAFLDTYNTLRQYNLKGIIHCFSGSLEVAEQYIKLGYVLGIGGVVTFKNSNLPEVVERIDLKNIVLETDSPYLAPTPHRGETNSPKFIPIVGEKISEIKKISTNDVEKITCDNVCRIFDLEI